MIQEFMKILPENNEGNRGKYHRYHTIHPIIPSTTTSRQELSEVKETKIISLPVKNMLPQNSQSGINNLM